MATKVKAELTLDDKASGVLSRIKNEFAETSKFQQQAQRGLSFFEQTLSTMAAVHLPNAIRGAAAFGASLVSAAADGEAFDSSIAALISTVQNVPFEESMAQARAFGDEFDALSIRTGVAIDSIESGFTRLLEIQGATVEGVKRSREQIAQLTTISSGLNLPLEAVSQEFAFMSEGMLKTRGRLFQLLQATGVFGQQTKGLAQGWAQFTDEQRMAVLSSGLQIASERLSKMPPTLHSMLGSLRNLAAVTKERLGERIAAQVTPKIEAFIQRIEKSSDRIEHYSRLLGSKVGVWVDLAAQKIEDGLDFLDKHGAEIWSEIVTAFQTAEQVVKFILAHKEELALALGAKAVAPHLAAVAKPAISGVSALYRAGMASEVAAGHVTAGSVGAVAGGVATVAAFAGAVAAFALAIDQWRKLMDETGGGQSDADMNLAAKREALERAAAAPVFGEQAGEMMAFIDRLEREATMLAAKQGESAEAFARLADAARRAQIDAGETMRQIDGFAHTLRTTFASMAEEDIEASFAAAQGIGDAFQAALKAQNAGAQQYIANVLAKSADLQTAFLTSSSMTAEGFEALAALVQDKAADFADKLRQKAGFAPDVVKPEVPKIQFNGGQTFKIQQDFRDEDPDRIALVFRRDILSAAERRLQATTSSPFGT